MVCSKTIIGFIVYKEGKTPNPKENRGSNQNANAQNTSRDPSVQWNGIILQMFHHKFASFMASITKLFKKTKVFEWIVEC